MGGGGDSATSGSLPRLRSPMKLTPARAITPKQDSIAITAVEAPIEEAHCSAPLNAPTNGKAHGRPAAVDPRAHAALSGTMRKSTT